MKWLKPIHILFAILATRIGKIHSLYLSSNQMNLITHLIRQPDIETYQREKIKKILYLSFEKYAIKKACDFKTFHKYKCQDINKEDLIMHSKMGLFKSIQKYNGNSSFLRFADVYIHHELYKGVTNHFSLSMVPKSIRIKSKRNLTENQKQEYKNALHVKWVSYSNYWEFDTLREEHENILDAIHHKQEYIFLWEKINKLDAFSKRVMHLMYTFDLKKKKTNKQVSELMCCSEENIRLHLNHTFEKIKASIQKTVEQETITKKANTE
jgi:RNA polymerase sigma factor (sigma-70 family)